MKKLSILGFVLALLISVSGVGGAVPLLDPQDDVLWAAIFQADATGGCEAPARSLASAPLSPAFMTADGEELSYCWCCAKTGHPDCCNPCFENPADQ